MTSRLAACALLLAAQVAQQPTFRGGTELVLVDAQVVDRNSEPVENLTAQAFEVWIDGKKRPAVTLTSVRHPDAAPLPAAALATLPSAGAPVTTAPAVRTEPRTIILGVDQASLLIVNKSAVIEAVTRLLAQVSPDDLVGLDGFPGPGPRVAPTRDRSAILAAAKSIDGQFMPPRPHLNISIAEAIDIIANDPQTIAEVRERECVRMGKSCSGPNTIFQIAKEIAAAYEIQAFKSIAGLKSLVAAVAEYPGRKTLVIISTGFASSDRIGSRPDIAFEADMLGKRAAEANAAIYSLLLDVSFLNHYSAANAGYGIQTAGRNATIIERGLDRFTGSAGGTMIAVPASPDRAIQRLLRETGSYYVLGVETLPELRDGKVHRINVRVNRRGTTVRARTAVFIPKAQ